MFAVALAASVLTASLVLGASAVVAVRLWRCMPWLAPAYGLLGVGLVAHASWILCWWSRSACFGFVTLVLIAAVAVVARANFWNAWRTWLPMLTISVSVLMLMTGHAFLWGGVHDPFTATANR